MKMAIFSLITSQAYDKTIKRLEEAYFQIKNSIMTGITNKSGVDEKRDNADILAILILKMRLNSN